MLSDEWLSRYGLLENFNASVTRTGTRTGTGTWTTGVTALRAVELKMINDTNKILIKLKYFVCLSEMWLSVLVNS